MKTGFAKAEEVLEASKKRNEIRDTWQMLVEMLCMLDDIFLVLRKAHPLAWFRCTDKKIQEQDQNIPKYNQIIFKYFFCLFSLFFFGSTRSPVRRRSWNCRPATTSWCLVELAPQKWLDPSKTTPTWPKSSSSCWTSLRSAVGIGLGPVGMRDLIPKGSVLPLRYHDKSRHTYCSLPIITIHYCSLPCSCDVAWNIIVFHCACFQQQ